jgi:hypothetical protein
MLSTEVLGKGKELKESPIRSFNSRIKTGVQQYVKNVFLFIEAPCVKYLYHVVSLLYYLHLSAFTIRHF